jgi:hypothetical protein
MKSPVQDSACPASVLDTVALYELLILCRFFVASLLTLAGAKFRLGLTLALHSRLRALSFDAPPPTRAAFDPQPLPPARKRSMHPVHDTDVVLLLATALAAKRRPAELVELVAAADLLAGAIPSEAKLADAFQRLSACGLICAVDENAYTLTPGAEKLMSGTRRKAATQERILNVKEKLAAFEAQDVFAAIALSAAQVRAAILAHRTAAKAPGRNLLLPKPPADAGTKPGQRQRKPLPSQRRKA